MAEYIEREAAKEFLAQDYAYAAAELLDYVPTADVVEVVRCKDCRHWGGVTFGYICRRFSGTTLRNETRENDYCSFGAKMDGKGEGE